MKKLQSRTNAKHVSFDLIIIGLYFMKDILIIKPILSYFALLWLLWLLSNEVSHISYCWRRHSLLAVWFCGQQIDKMSTTTLHVELWVSYPKLNVLYLEIQCCYVSCKVKRDQNDASLFFFCTVHILELHTQELIWTIQKNRQLLFSYHISGTGKASDLSVLGD